LCAACCALGAHFAGADERAVSRLERFGLSLGIAFQMQDDILDIVGDTDVVGKTLGIDVEKGKMTLPIIHFLRTAPREHRALLRSLLSSRDADKMERIRNLILPSDSIEYARASAHRFIEQAQSSLRDLPETDARNVLEMMAEFVIARAN
jgi:octaprenyl-diphosphate synthase